MKATKFETVNDYLESLPMQSADRLNKIRQTIQKIFPDAEEIISYQMPAFRYHGILVWYAAFKNHYSLFMPKILRHFKEELKEFETTKSAIRIPMEKPVPVQLLKKLIRFGATKNIEEEKIKKQLKKK